MNAVPSATDPMIWRPSEEELRASRILAFAGEHNILSVSELVRRADEDPAWFWGAVADWLGIQWQVTPSAVVDDLDRGAYARWYVGGSLNLAENAVDRWVRQGRAGETALSWQTDDGATGSWTFRELQAQVDRLGHGLRSLGVRPGDTVGVQLPMVREAAVALLACAKTGAICVPVFSGFGPSAVVERLRAAGAKVHIVADAYRRRGRRIDVRTGLAPALATVPSIVATVVAALDPIGPDITGAAPDQAGTGAKGARATLRFPGEEDWDRLVADADPRPLDGAVLPADHPLLIAYTSGSTGRPKGVVLTHAGFAVKAGSDAAFCFGLGPGEVGTWITDPGWIMFPITLLGGLIAGSATALFGGTPDHPGTDRMWNFARATGVTMLGVSPTLVRTLMGAGADPSAAGVPSLRRLASSGEPWTPDAYAWLFADAFGRALPIINYSGGTEVSGGILANTTAQPIFPCAFAGSLPGMAADVVDTEGVTLGAGVGELVLRRPSPGMPSTFWEEPERYAQTYWATWPGIWHHGDWAERTPDAWYIHGRSDDTLKIAGKRVGPAEVEGVVNAVPGVVESAAIGVPDGIKGDALVVFARCADDAGIDPSELPPAISAALVSHLGPTMRPRSVHIAAMLPRTRSGKILRRVIRALFLGEPTGDVSALQDPSALAAIEALR
ncbi:AMP-binding protein [Dactylosporangium sp. NPDC051485]|uniref:AMP-binding protein n=1 Tax=Dactylosporangium sp. NPDC051485 TaxID=3154846 RepID=UPI003412BDCA